MYRKDEMDRITLAKLYVEDTEFKKITDLVMVLKKSFTWDEIMIIFKDNTVIDETSERFVLSKINGIFFNGQSRSMTQLRYKLESIKFYMRKIEHVCF